jgi:glucokinase
LVATASAIVDELALPECPVGVGAAGLVNHDGRVLYSPNLPTVREAPLRDALAAATHHRLVVDNDANVAALGEIAYGAARGLRHALLVTLGTGIGGGMLINGELYRGAHGFGAEIGHITVERGGPLCACGERGHWEACSSGHALGRLGREAARSGRAPGLLDLAGGDAGRVTSIEVAAAAEAGDPGALAVLDAYAADVAVGFAGLVNILDPALIVVSGGLVDLGDLLFDPLRRAFAGRVEGASYRPPVAIVPAVLGDLAGVIGAAALARDAR